MKTHRIIERIVKTPALIAGLMTVFLSLSVQQASAENFLDKLNKKLEQANSKIQKNAPNQPASGQDRTPAAQQSETAPSRNDAPNMAPGALAKNSSSAPSVVGIRLGMTESEAVAALKAFDPKLEISRRTHGEIFAQTTRPDLSSDEIIIIVLPPPGPEVVVAVRRTNRLSQGKVMSVPELLGTLRSKYGEGANMYEGGSSRWWFFDLKGKPVAPPMVFKSSQRCSGHSRSMGGFEVTFQYYDTDIAYNKRDTGQIKKDVLDPACGRMLEVIPSTTENRDIANGLTMTLVDHATYYQALAPTRNYRISQKKAHDRQEAEKAKGHGLPSL